MVWRVKMGLVRCWKEMRCLSQARQATQAALRRQGVGMIMDPTSLKKDGVPEGTEDDANGAVAAPVVRSLARTFVILRTPY